jgi:hypothetical protein
VSLGLEEAAGLVGGHCWIERRLFELLGVWSTADGSVPGATLVLDRHAQHAAWRAQQWWDRLPVLAGVDRDALVRPDGPWSALDHPTVAGPGPGAPGRDRQIARLVVAYRVLLPRLVGRYDRHAAGTSELADGPVRRTFGHVRPDLVGDWVDGELLVAELLIDDAAVTAAAGAVSAAERLWII